MARKYEILRDQTLEHEGRTLYRIRRHRDGLVGGWIEKEENLSRFGSCFVFDDAKVFDNAKVYGNAQIFGHAEVYESAKVRGTSKVRDAKIHGHTVLFGNA